jgi:hypothetical protein
MTEIKKITLVISQPMTSKNPSTSDFENNDAIAFSTEVVRDKAATCRALIGRPIAEIAEHLVSGDEQCKYCKARATCPELAKQVDEATAKEFAVIPETGATGFVGMGPSELAALYLKLPLIRSWCDGMQARVETATLAGDIGQEHGLKVVMGKAGNRAWDNPEAVEAEMKSMRVKQDEMYTFKLISPTQAEKVLADNPRKWKKLSEHIIRPPGSKQVVSVDAKGEAINVRPTTEGFEQVPTDDGSDLC